MPLARSEATTGVPTGVQPPAATPRASIKPSPPPSGPAAPTGPTTTARVTRVVDGDTIHVLLGGRDQALRYIGMDAPELVKPGSPVEAFARESSAANAALVAGKDVVLERDVSETDRFGRLLRDVWLKQGATWMLVNRELVVQGFATVTTFPPDVKYAADLIAAERWARDAGVGLWASAETGAAPSAPPIPSKAAPVGLVSRCDPAYPGRCIPPPPPDLDCADIGHRVTVLPPDPHNLDGDHDGIGCESYPP